jgi:hypothetical protein
MEYTKMFNRLRELFTQEGNEIIIPESDIRIINSRFCSDLPDRDFISNNDRQIEENHSFSYPVFVPGSPLSDRVILLFHGLNERSWLKYLTWAYTLADLTGSYVILFPISFHINRSPASWSNPRTMSSFLRERDNSAGRTELSSFVNVALSQRLTDDPMRFFKSGYQTVDDIVKLASEISEGRHPVVPRTGRLNIFSYSIGAFMAEIIMMGNPGGLFTDSRLFIFCGGSVFSNMRGASKFIMDKRAFDKVYDFYLNDFENTITANNPLSDFLMTNPVGIAFRSMIDLGRFRVFRENMFRQLRDQISTISLEKDAIIPARGVISTLSDFDRKRNLRVWDFPFGYSHENPFPIFDSSLSKAVDYWFEKTMEEAVQFLS